MVRKSAIRFQHFLTVMRLLAGSLAVGLAIYLVLFSSLLTIKKIDCTQDGNSCSEDVLADLNKQIGKKTMFLDRRQIENRLVEADKNISQAKVTIKLPDRISIILVSRIAVAQIGIAPSNQEVLLLDQNNTVIGKSIIAFNLPVVFGSEAGSLSIGQNAGVRIGRAITIADSLRMMGKFGNAIINGDMLTVIGGEMGEIIFSLDKEPETQLQSLQVLTNQVRIDQLDQKVIDLRFERPIVK